MSDSTAAPTAEAPFPTIGTAVDAYADFSPVDQIESLCMECHEQVSLGPSSRWQNGADPSVGRV